MNLQINESKQSIDPVLYPTGFSSFDFRNGCILQSHRPNSEPIEYLSTGIQDGSMITIIGRSGSGKADWAIQSAANIVKNFKNSLIYYDNLENNITHEKILKLTNFTEDEFNEKYVHRNSGITSESFYYNIRDIANYKLDNINKFKYDTELFDIKGERIYKLQPTVYILDSVSCLLPEKDIEEYKLHGKPTTSDIAKINSAVFRRILPILKEANIILLIINHINHINQKVETYGFLDPRYPISFLKPNEDISCGMSALFLSDLIIRIDHTPSYFNIIKSRTNRAGGEQIPLIFNQDGFDKILSLFELLKQKGIINEINNEFYIKNINATKFSKETLKYKLESDINFEGLFNETVYELLVGYLNKTTISKYNLY